MSATVTICDNLPSLLFIFYKNGRLVIKRFLKINTFKLFPRAVDWYRFCCALIIMDLDPDTLLKLDRLQASLDTLIHELQSVRSEIRLKTKETVTQELLTVLDDVAKIADQTRTSLALGEPLNGAAGRQRRRPGG